MPASGGSCGGLQTFACRLRLHTAVATAHASRSRQRPALGSAWPSPWTEVGCHNLPRTYIPVRCYPSIQASAWESPPLPGIRSPALVRGVESIALTGPLNTVGTRRVRAEAYTESSKQTAASHDAGTVFPFWSPLGSGRSIYERCGHPTSERYTLAFSNSARFSLQRMGFTPS